MKKISLILCVALLLCCITACAPADDGKYVIGICQIEPHPALDQATQGFIDEVTAQLGEENVEFLVKNAAGDSNTLNSIINDFVAKKVDMILANSTPVLQTAAAATTVIPILGTSVTEYGVALGLDNFDGTVGGNVSGTSDLAPLNEQADMILEWFPEAKNIGLLYCAAEANSKYQVDTVKAYLEEKGLNVTPYAFSSSSDLAAVTTQAATSSDVIYVPTDNTVANGAAVVDSVCRPLKVPVIAGESNTCAGCGVATLSISYYDLGVSTGKMAVKILKGNDSISTMPIEYAGQATPMYNAEICAELGLTPPEGYTPIS